ncbi:MAG: zinc ribbon domain-containing protein, partial [Candidatus Woesearchaeota archaeon]
LLKGIVKCLDCGGNMSQHTQRWKNKNGTVINRQLRCSNYIHKSICYYNHIKLEEINKIVIDRLKTVINKVEINDNINIINSNTNEIVNNLKKMKNDLKTFDKKFERQMKVYEEGLITIDELRKFKARLENEQKELQDNILKKEKELNNNNIEYDKLKSTLKNALEVLESDYTIADKHRIIKIIIKEIRFSLENKEVQIDLIY